VYIEFRTNNQVIQKQLERLVHAIRLLEAQYWLRPRRSASVDRQVAAAVLWAERTFSRTRMRKMPEADKNRRGRVGLGFVLLCATALVFAGWGSVFYLGFAKWDKESLALRGTFGDSFGVLSCLFAGLAFIGAAWAVVLQREQLNEQQAEQRNADERARADQAENRFFHLLDSLQTAVNQTTVEQIGKTYVGRHAISKLVDILRVHMKQKTEERGAGVEYPIKERQAEIDKWFTDFYEQSPQIGGKPSGSAPAGDILGHIIRLIYHILKFVEENHVVCPDDKKFFVRILRAHLSNPELLLIFYNGLSHYGYRPLYDLIERHDLLQNINQNSLIIPSDARLYPSLAKLSITST
jgi:hypothetical protein